MEKRLVRYADLKGLRNAFIDARTPGSDRKENFTIIGPGVAPDAYWESPAPGPYNRELDLAANAEQLALVGDAKLCRPN